GRLHLDLAQHQHDLLRTWPVSSLHPQLLWSKLILSISPVQSQPVRSLAASADCPLEVTLRLGQRRDLDGVRMGDVFGH
ncbi:hypothetical protein MKK65_14045, partial [Methylobacterium sp. J-001]|uniref:hypothetical protein n=1 Tax=Methylobacterium sp. J-001 TaxID=2836609 RepID=UPI001FBBE3F6